MDKKIDENVLRRRRRGRLLKIGAGAVATVALVVGLMAMVEKSVDGRELVVAEVDRADMETAVPASGRVVPAYEEVINSPVSTRLLSVQAVAGDSVRAGQTLIELDLAAEQTNFDKMVDRQRISRQELTQQQLQAQTTLSELEMQISV